MIDATRTAADPNTHTADPVATTSSIPSCIPVDPHCPAFPLPDGYDQPESLGEGGMGVVCRARDTRFDREVAIKTLLPQKGQSPRVVAEFRREAKITGRLQHPGIPPVHEMGTLPDGRPYMVMKLVRGQTLAHLLAERGPGPAAWLGEFEAVCHAVGYAHSYGVIHRDLKPSNVMVGAFGEVQVMDWGLAKVLNTTEFDLPEDDEEGLPDTHRRMSGSGHTLPPTRTGTTKGTPAFMSPEQARGETRLITERSDVFSLGAVLLTLLTGKPPYTGEDIYSVLRDAATADLTLARRRLNKCGASRDVIALCRRCLSADPADRPANAEVVAEEIARIRKAAERAVQTRRVRQWQLVLVGVVLAVASALGISVWLIAQAEREKAVVLVNTRVELTRTLDEVERRLARGDWDEGAERFLDAMELAGRDPDPASPPKERLEKVRRDVRTSRDLLDFFRSYADNRKPSWGTFSKAFNRVGITLDLANPEATARQISLHPFAGVFHTVLLRQAEFEHDPDLRQRLLAVAANPRFEAAAIRAALADGGIARRVEAGAQVAQPFAPNMFGD